MEESIRSFPPSVEHPTFVVALDGMDQATWGIPRFKNLRTSKSLGQFVRPRLRLQGVWLFHVCLTLYLYDPDMPHDAALTIECLARSLERGFALCRDRGLPAPVELVAWACGPVYVSESRSSHPSRSLPGATCCKPSKHSHPRPTTPAGRTRTHTC